MIIKCSKCGVKMVVDYRIKACLNCGAKIELTKDQKKHLIKE